MRDWFADRVVVVTGAASGLGLATASAFAEAGARVAVVDVRDDRAAEAATTIRDDGGDCAAFTADVSDGASVRAVFQQVLADLGTPWVVVANAGVYPNTPFLDVPEDEWDRVVDINLKGAFLTCQAGAALMKDAGGGCIVTVASGVAVNVLPGWSHYSASKAGIVALTRAMALELGVHGIRVNAVMPGYFEVGSGGAHLDQRYRTAAASLNALRRPGATAELAAAVLLLASPLASFVTGAVLPVDGGSSVGKIGLSPR